MRLTDTAIRKAKPQDKIYTLTDGDGMYLEVTPNGGKWWRFKYRFDGKQKRLSLGTYPDTGLKDARDKRYEARKQLSNGVDPASVRKVSKVMVTAGTTESFEVVAREWIAKQSPKWAESHVTNILGRLERDVFPWIGKRTTREIEAPELLSMLRRIEERGAVETAHRTLQNCGQIFRYAIATGRAQRDFTPDLRGALAQAVATHLPAITDPKTIGALLRAIDGYTGSFVTRCALQLAPLVFVRPGELRTAEWAEINLEQAEWNIPALKMKMRQSHLVPLSTQAVAILQEIQPLTGKSQYIFPSPRTRTRPMSNNAVLAALRRMGFGKDEMTGHGFRAMARTVLDEVLQVRPDYIEHQLAHAVRDPNGRAYNRTSHLGERRKMMQVWADYLDQLKASVIEAVPVGSQLDRNTERR